MKSANFFGSVARIFARRASRIANASSHGDRLEVAGAALGAGAAPQGARQPRGRVLLHDPRGALGADHALVEGVLGIAVDVAHLAVAQVHADAAAARAHVARGGLDLGFVGHGSQGVRLGFENIRNR